VEIVEKAGFDRTRFIEQVRRALHPAETHGGASWPLS